MLSLLPYASTFIKVAINGSDKISQSVFIEDIQLMQCPVQAV